MSTIIHPRSPREQMCGWVHLPRFVDKIRLHLAGRLHPDYRENFTKGFDGQWLKAAGLEALDFIEQVKQTITDGEVADWVGQKVKRSEAEKRAFAEFVLNYPRPDDAAGQERLQMRKEQAGIAHRADVRAFVDFIDADEGRL